MLISVILPVHKKRSVEFVVAAVNSVVNQCVNAPHSLELIVIIDGPIEANVEIVLNKKKRRKYTYAYLLQRN